MTINDPRTAQVRVGYLAARRVARGEQDLQVTSRRLFPYFRNKTFVTVTLRAERRA